MDQTYPTSPRLKQHKWFRAQVAARMERAKMPQTQSSVLYCTQNASTVLVAKLGDYCRGGLFHQWRDWYKIFEFDDSVSLRLKHMIMDGCCTVARFTS